jgi:hypothetical protein
MIEMKAKPSDKPREFVEGMLGNLYKNPDQYALTVGELSAILWMVHHLWAGIADCEEEFIDIRCKLYGPTQAKKIERVRSDSIQNIKSRQVVMNLWKKIDAKVGLDARSEQYDQFI